MFDRLGIDSSDRRKAGIVVVAMAAIMILFLDGPIPARVVAATVLGLTSGLCFLLTTALLDRLVPG